MKDIQSLAANLDQSYDRDYVVNNLVSLLKVPTNVPLGEHFIDPDDPKLVHYVREIVMPILEQLPHEEIVIDDLNNLIMRVGKGRNGKSLLIMAYTPDQHANLMKDPFSGKIVNAKELGHDELCAFGQGASQNKGSLAAIMGALKMINDMGAELEGQLIFALNNEGRSSHTCTAYIMEGQKLQPDAAILCTGTFNRITLGNRGRVDVNITVKGKSCHSSQPWSGLNAIDGVNAVLNRLKSMEFDKEHPRLGRSQLTVYHVDFSPIAPHTLPEVGNLTVDRRLLPSEDIDQAVSEIIEAVGDLSPFSLEIKKGVYMCPAEVSEDAEIVQVIQEGFKSFRGRPTETYYPMWTYDAGYTSQKGIPTLQLGPSSFDSAGDDLMGTDFVALSQVEEAAKVYAYTILKMLS